MSIHPGFTVYPILILGTVLFLSSGYVNAQEGSPAQTSTQTGPSSLEKAVSRIQAGDYNTDDVREILSDKDEARVRPVLEHLFPKVQNDRMLKDQIASVLVRMKDPSDMYYTYLADSLRASLESGVPTRSGDDDLPGASTPLAIWARSHNVTIPAAERQADDLVWDVVSMSASLDIRSIPLLRLCLTSPNLIASGLAAQGLAYLKDNDSIDVIAAAINASDPTKQEVLATEMLRFDNDRADSVATPYLDKERLDQMKQRKAERQREALQASQAPH